MKSFSIFFLLGLALFTSCVTQKSKKDQSALGKLYHNTTARYNGYYNATVLLDEGITQLETQHRDDYNKVLPLYKYTAVQDPQAVASKMDDAIKKVSVVATLHETSRWTDDCYLLIGKAFYIKQDYESAENALEFFLKEFNPDGTRITKGSGKSKKKSKKSKAERAKEKRITDKERKRAAKKAEAERKAYNKQLKKRKKKSSKKRGSDKDNVSPRKPGTGDIKNNLPDPPETRPKKDADEKKDPDEKMGGLRHLPAYQEAILWLARTYIERDNFNAASYQFARLERESQLQEKVRRELPVVRAEFSIRQNDFPKAVLALDEAITEAPKRLDKARYAYIKAQLLDAMNQPGQAYEAYLAVMDYKPDYEMLFNTNLNIAVRGVAGNGSSSASAEKALNKMLKDDKNAEFKDQIYYALAQIALTNRDQSAAIDFLKLSAENGTQNTSQKTETNYLLATLYFQNKDYVEAKSAYDATLQTMPKEDERYKTTELLSNNLTDIATHLETIALQDSLLRISEMTEDQQKDLAKAILKKQKEEASAKEAMAENRGPGPRARTPGKQNQAQRAGAPQVRTASTSPATTQSSFFAYDEKTLKRSKREFEKNWGNRPLADNWRLSSVVQGVAGEEILAPDYTPAISDMDLDGILKDVPKTEEAKETARDLIKQAMLNLGTLYRDKLESPEESVSTLEELITTYPGSPYELDALYQLYISYTELANSEKAEYYKSRIINEFSESKFALALSDPDYLKNLLSKEEQIRKAYDQAFMSFEQGNAQEAMTQIESAQQEFGTGHELQPKFSLLEALATGQLEGKDAYIVALKNVVAQYPNTPEATKARDMLLLLGVYKPSTKKIPTSSDGTTAAFKVQPEAIHFVLVMISNFDDINTRDTKIAISEYNKEYHNLEKLKISSLVIDPKTRQSLILIRTFENADKALAYRAGVLKNPTKFLPPNIQFEVYPVTQHNYREVIKQRSLEEYIGFFAEHYQ